ncbi:MAG: FKBP-type peptidyl-prolyl cis-trans isomerase [Burkholderiaceae bacterium]
MNTRSAGPADAGAAATVAPGAHLTLHYRLSLADSGSDVINTFGERPATLTLGLGQLAEALEQCLLGLSEGERRVFELDSAFGPRNPDMVQKLSRTAFDANVDAPGEFQAGDPIELPLADGRRMGGVLKALTDRYALLDFNHPLAGQRVQFEVHILGVL